MKYFVLLAFLLSLAACSSDDVFENGEKVLYYPGTQQVKQIVHYRDHKKNGYMKEFYKDGTLKASQFFVNDSLDDTTCIYSPDGKLRTLHTYKNKMRDGCWREYNQAGQLYSELFFKKGKLDSVCSQYSYRSVKLLTRIHYSHGLKNGTEEHYYPNGTLKSRETYTLGELCMGTEEWNEKGEKINNDFKILISENVLLDNKLVYKIRIENAGPDDCVYQVLQPGKGNSVGPHVRLIQEQKSDVFLCKFDVPPGGFVMEEVELAAYKKTRMGNTVIKTRKFNAAYNNF